MRKIVCRCFPKAIRVIDRFHVQKLAHDSLQEMRIAIAGMQSTGKHKLRKNPNYWAKNTPLNCLKTVILTNNFLQEAGICSSNLRINGRPNKNKEPNFFLNFIPI
ncbi:hypothetical protein EZS27_009820 [termite gut metagenome]|uniref:Transposase IS204/IS1001/IS1096/IS1165 DDE domain-containing protein n=1 Tax=termite gut metagenome TaxID=433724 RepID=A0A5J4S8F7_9ZZZZ